MQYFSLFHQYISPLKKVPVSEHAGRTLILLLSDEQVLLSFLRALETFAYVKKKNESSQCVRGVVLRTVRYGQK